MSTRSLIAIQRDVDKYEYIYCHFDGYLTYNGAMLLDYYSDKNKVDELMKLGDISQLNKELYPDETKPHNEFEKQEGITLAYGRDCGEKDTESRISDLNTLLSNSSGIDYIYIFSYKGQWYYLDNLNSFPKSVKTGLEKEYKDMKIERPKDFYGFWAPQTIEKERNKQNEEVL